MSRKTRRLVQNNGYAVIETTHTSKRGRLYKRRRRDHYPSTKRSGTASMR
jgi:hypothetical protein